MSEQKSSSIASVRRFRRLGSRAIRRATAAVALGLLACALPAALVSVETVHARLAQPADAVSLIAEARSLLSQQQYEEALTLLQQVDASAVDEAGQVELADLLARAGTGAEGRRVARAWFEQGQQSWAAGDYVAALGQFGKAYNNPYADEGTAAKAAEQIALCKDQLAAAGTSMGDLYRAGKREFNAGDYVAARTKFEALNAVGFRPGLFDKRPSQYLELIEANLGAAVPGETPAVAVATPEPVVVEVTPAEPVVVETPMSEPVVEATPAQPAAEPALVVATPAGPTDAAAAAREAYLAGIEAYKAGDMAAAREAFSRAERFGYRKRLFETSPATFIARIDQRAADEAAAAQVAAEAAAASQPVAVEVVTSEPAVVEVTPVEPAPDVAQVTPAAPISPLQATIDAERLKAEQAAYEARLLVEQADQKRASKEYDDALALYTAAIQKDPTNSAAIAGRDAMLQITGRDAGSRDIGQVYSEIVQAKRGAIEFTLNSALAESRAAREAQDFTAARNALVKAQAARDSDTGIFTPDELKAFDTQIASERSMIANEEAAFVAAKTAAERAKALKEQEAARRAEEDRRRSTIASLRKQGRQLTQQQNYEEAMAVVEQILTIDPQDDYALGVRQLIQDKIHLSNLAATRRKYDKAFTDVVNAADEALIPLPSILTYPEDWPDLSLRRDETVAKERGGTEDARVIELLDRRLPEVRFNDIPFRDVIEYLIDTTQANIVVNWQALEGQAVDPNAPITTRLRDVTLRKVLRVVLDIAGGGAVPLGYSIDEGVIAISTTDDLARNTSTRTYDIRDLLVIVPDFAENAPDFNIGQTTSTGGGGGGQGPFGGGGTGNNFDDNERDDLIEQIIALIQDTIAPDSWRDAGGLVGAVRELGGQLIITQTPENHTQIQRLLEQLRETRAIQISIEARFITVQRNFLEEVGVDFDFAFNIDPTQPNLFNPNSNYSPVNVTQGSPTPGDGTGAFFTQPNTLQTGIPGNLGPSGSDVNNGVSTRATFSAFLDDFRASLFVRATQLGQNANSISAPRITLFNGQSAWIAVSNDIAYVSDLTPQVGGSAVGFDPEISIVSSGVALTIYQATVSADRKYVTLTLQPSRNRLIALRTFSTFTGTTIDTGDTTGSSQIFTGIIQQPEIERTSLQTTVSIPDRGTLLLGGLTLAGEVEREQGVPVLSRIPFLKRLFTNTGRAKDEQILLIMVKPTIIIQREVEQENFPILEER